MRRRSWVDDRQIDAGMQCGAGLQRLECNGLLWQDYIGWKGSSERSQELATDCYLRSLHLTATLIVRNDVLCNTLRRILRTRQASNPSKFTNSLSKAIFDQAPELWAPQASNLTALKDGYHTLGLEATARSGYLVGSSIRSERLVDVPGVEALSLDRSY
jgi:hypothetical protein